MIRTNASKTSRRAVAILAATAGVLGLGGMAPVAASAEGKKVSATSPSPATQAQGAGRINRAGVFRNPLNGGADPFIAVANKTYYLATTQGDRLSIWASKSLGGLLNAPAKTVWVGANDDPSRNTQIWAPSLYRFTVNGQPHWYLYYTASDGKDENHRMYVLESAGDDPLGPYHFKAKLADYGVYSIDGEPIVHNGKMYFAWSSPGRGSDGGPNQIYLATMPNPWTTSGEKVPLPIDNGGCQEVREGPTTLRHQNTMFLTYSTCDTGKPDYQLWTISIQNGADPMVRANWKEHPKPLMTRNDAAGVYGPGHHSFFKSPDGKQDWIAYHGKNSAEYTYDWRTTRAQQVTWNRDGTPHIDRPVALGADVKLPSGDPGPTSRAINDIDLLRPDLGVSYQGGWKWNPLCLTQCFWGTEHTSSTAGDTATFRFTGSQIVVLSARDPGSGIAAISVDGGPEVRVDFYAKPRTGQLPNYVSPVLKHGKHTLKIRVTGEKNGASTGTSISVDRAEVWR